MPELTVLTRPLAQSLFLYCRQNLKDYEIDTVFDSDNISGRLGARIFCGQCR